MGYLDGDGIALDRDLGSMPSVPVFEDLIKDGSATLLSTSRESGGIVQRWSVPAHVWHAKVRSIVGDLEFDSEIETVGGDGEIEYWYNAAKYGK